MSVDAAEVRRLAELAAVTLDDAAIPDLVRQLRDILELIGRLPGRDPDALPFRPGPQAAPLRSDTVDPVPLRAPPADFGPDVGDGLFQVPRLDSFQDGP